MWDLRLHRQVVGLWSPEVRFLNPARMGYVGPRQVLPLRGYIRSGQLRPARPPASPLGNDVCYRYWFPGRTVAKC